MTSVAALPTAAGLPLDPASLSGMAEAAESALLRQGECENTLRSYRSALRYWAAWFWLRYGQPIRLPVPETTVVQFIVDHAQLAEPDGRLTIQLPPDVDQALVAGGFKGRPGPLALSTLTHRLAVLSKAHQAEAAANPCAQARVRDLVAKVRRGYAKRGVVPRQMPALTREPLEALLATCDESLIGLRDRALLLFGFASGGRRRSEVVAATLENTRREGDHFIFTLAHSKTNQLGVDHPSNDKPVVGRAAQALRAWLQASKIESGAIFRRVSRGGGIGAPLLPGAVRNIVKARSALAELPDAYSAHSLRSGFVTEACRQEVPEVETRAMTGHRSLASVARYYRPDARTVRSARLLED